MRLCFEIGPLQRGKSEVNIAKSRFYFQFHIRGPGEKLEIVLRAPEGNFHPKIRLEGCRHR